jgi:hypothetical protein
MQDVSVREIAECIKRPHEALNTVVDRIRGWSDVGLIEVLGSKFPGTGSKRRYAASAFLDAAVLTGLTDAGLAAVRAGQFQGARGQTVLSFGRLGAVSVFNPGTRVGTDDVFNPNERVYLVIGGSPTASDQIICVAYGLEQVALPPQNWLIILNLNQIFEPLRGIVTATYNKGGFVDVEFIEAPGPKFYLVCTSSTGSYVRGQQITDPAEIASLSQDAEHFVRVAAQPVRRTRKDK